MGRKEPDLSHVHQVDGVERKTIMDYVNFLLDGDEDKFDILRIWEASSRKCAICGDDYKEFSLMYANLKHKKGIAYFCYTHAQEIQDILIERGLHIQTEDEAQIMEDKLKKVEALPKEEEDIEIDLEESPEIVEEEIADENVETSEEIAEVKEEGIDKKDESE